MKLTLTNKDGAVLDLLNNKKYFILTKTSNFHGVDTDIITSESPYLDGAIIDHVKANPRGISMTFNLVPDIKRSIDFFTSYVKSKQWVTLTETEGGMSRKIEGIATLNPYSRMESMCKIELSIYCGQPYWRDAQDIVSGISMYIALLNFPHEKGQYFTAVDGKKGGRVFSVIDTNAEKTIENDGDASVGMTIHATALGDVSNPRISCSSGDQVGWYMQMNIDLKENDELEICTERGNKYITLNGSGTYNGVPLLSLLEFVGEDWLQLETGKNTFNVGSYVNGKLVTTDRLYFTIVYRRKFQ